MYVDPRFGANCFILFNLGGKRLNQIHQSGQQYVNISKLEMIRPLFMRFNLIFTTSSSLVIYIYI